MLIVVAIVAVVVVVFFGILQKTQKRKQQKALELARQEQEAREAREREQCERKLKELRKPIIEYEEAEYVNGVLGEIEKLQRSMSTLQAARDNLARELRNRLAVYEERYLRVSDVFLRMKYSISAFDAVTGLYRSQDVRHAVQLHDVLEDLNILGRTQRRNRFTFTKTSRVLFALSLAPEERFEEDKEATHLMQVIAKYNAHIDKVKRQIKKQEADLLEAVKALENELVRVVNVEKKKDLGRYDSSLSYKPVQEVFGRIIEINPDAKQATMLETFSLLPYGDEYDWPHSYRPTRSTLKRTRFYRVANLSWLRPEETTLSEI